MERCVDEVFVGFDGAWKPELLDERVGKPLGRAQLSEGAEQGGGERWRSDFLGEPGTGLILQQIDQALRGGRGHDGQTAGGGLKQGIRHGVVTGGEDKERRVRIPGAGVGDVSQEKDGRTKV